MTLAADMRTAAATLLSGLPPQRREQAAYGFGDDAARRWIEYRPNPRPGVRLADLDPAGRKSAHRLLATGLSPHAYAQAMAVVALEEVLDRIEGWQLGRHSTNYYVSVFGEPDPAGPWSWRFEGHHISVSMTVVGDEVSAAPVFLGANPHRVGWAGRAVSRPLGPEEDLARALLEAAGERGRAALLVADEAPGDIRSSVSPAAPPRLEPVGVAASDLPPAARAILDQLVALYLERLPGELAAREAARLAGSELYMAWSGATVPGRRHYYRIQGDDLLIEYDNTTADGNHSHTVLRRPRGDFGDDILARHRAAAHGQDSG
jgi:hypothetical protein